MRFTEQDLQKMQGDPKYKSLLEAVEKAGGPQAKPELRSIIPAELPIVEKTVYVWPESAHQSHQFTWMAAFAVVTALFILPVAAVMAMVYSAWHGAIGVVAFGVLMFKVGQWLERGKGKAGEQIGTRDNLESNK
jgi:hypothetical protein